MRFCCLTFCAAIFITASALPGLANSHARRGPASNRLFGKRNSRTAPPKPVSQRAIDPERTTAIQSALIKQGYLSGEPTGKWDPETQAALEKLQGENGWQTKFVPDSRAIIKLGLGPSSPASEPGTKAASSGSTFPSQE